jgi:hypothetical protein
MSTPQSVTTSNSKTTPKPTPKRIKHTFEPGQRVAYYIEREVTTGHYGTVYYSKRIEKVRRVGIVLEWRKGKVAVKHAAGYTQIVAKTKLQLID